ncbi:hypothetical protein Ancab_013306 [Ancistrocladus abbreviatus]
MVLANNQFRGGCLPAGIGKMAGTLAEINLLNLGLSGCLPPEIGKLTMLTVFDVSFNDLSGTLPKEIGSMKSLEQLDVAHNELRGDIPESICRLPNLINFTYSFNYFSGEPYECLNLKAKSDEYNCIPNRPMQRSPQVCENFLSRPVDCSAGCYGSPPPSPLSGAACPSPSPTMALPPSDYSPPAPDIDAPAPDTDAPAPDTDEPAPCLICLR